MARLVEVKRQVLSKNDRLASKLRRRFAKAGVTVFNLVSSPGSGKTALLEQTLRKLKERNYRVAALVGDLQTENDAQRLRRSGAQVKQINTCGLCHLEAQMVEDQLQDWTLEELDFLFIENVGNLVCPSAFDLGENLRVVLLSVTEGEDKPLKYPPVFISAGLVVITKVDLSEPCKFDEALVLKNLEAVHPGVPVLSTSAHSGEGMDSWLDFLESSRS